MMSADAARRQDVLSDSEATLRQVQGVLSELGTHDPAADARVDRVVNDLERKPAGLRDLVQILMSTYGEIMNVIDSLRRSRGLLEQAAMERLKSTHQKLAEVSSATEMAATGMLDGLDRALVLVDHLESAADPAATNDGGALRDELREELHALINLLQFQDITAQQLGYAGGVLMDIEERMVELAKIFDVRGVGLEDLDEGKPADHRCKVTEARTTCDPEASHFGADSRQALADEIFTAPGR
jgi:hypothetical protein